MHSATRNGFGAEPGEARFVRRLVEFGYLMIPRGISILVVG